MSFPVVLYANTSPSNMVSKNIAVVATATGVLRSGTSIIDPVILIEVAIPANIISQANYCRIESFGRYYFITDVKSDANGLWNISCHVDVLMTYSEQIKAQNAIVARQYLQYNMYLDDGWFMAYQNPIVQQRYLSNLTPFEAQEYVLVISGS